MEKENIQVDFTLKGIKTEQFAIFEENYSPQKEAGLDAELQFRLDQKNKHIGVFLGLDFIQGKNIFLKIQVSCHFIIDEKSWTIFIQDNKKLVIPKGLLEHLAVITIGATRGIVFAKTEGTQFSQFLVPTLNVTEMLKEDASFDLLVE